MMVSVDIGDIRFTHRAGAIAISSGRIMLTRTVGGTFWFIPGGRIEIGEDSKTAVRREMREEIGQDIEDIGLECIVENFFIEKGKEFHEVGIYYSVRVPEPWEGSRYLIDGGIEAEYLWAPLEDLENMILLPEIIKDRILGKNAGIHLITDMRK